MTLRNHLALRGLDPVLPAVSVSMVIPLLAELDQPYDHLFVYTLTGLVLEFYWSLNGNGYVAVHRLPDGSISARLLLDEVALIRHLEAPSPLGPSLNPPFSTRICDDILILRFCPSIPLVQASPTKASEKICTGLELG